MASQTNRRPRRRPLLIAALALLTLDTILLLAVSYLFFTAPPVRLQIRHWIGEAAPETLQQAGPSGPAANAGLPAEAAEPTPTAANEPTEAAPPAPQFVDPGLPAPEPIYRVVVEPPPDGSLVIPSLKIHHPVVSVPVNGAEWDLSRLDAQVGWLQTTGSRPRDDLAMVFIGHITLPYPGGPGPFLYLNRLKPGDTIEYQTEDARFVYRVESTQVVDPDDIQSLYRADGSRLLLVTCTTYNALERKYDQRLIVEAALEQATSLKPGMVGP